MSSNTARNIGAVVRNRAFQLFGGAILRHYQLLDSRKDLVGLLTMQKRNIRRTLGEFVLIVLGVMVALAADSWREFQVERSQERRYLQRFIEDLEGSLAGFPQARESMDNVTAHGLAVLPYLRGKEGSASPTSIFASMYQASRAVYPTIIDDTYAELMCTSGLSIIGHESLRQKIVALYRVAERGNLTNIVERDNVAYRYAMRKAVPVEIQLAVREACGLRAKPLTCSALAHILDDREPEHNLHLWLQSIDIEKRRIQGLVDQVEELLGMARTELGD